MFLVRKVKNYLRKRKWRKLNSHNETHMANDFRFERVSVGKCTYGGIYVVDHSPDNVMLKIGNYCSIASDVKFLLAGEHNINTVTTYPFGFLKFGASPGAKSKGDIVVGDDVWICENALICSGVHIGQGAIVAAGAVVTKDVPPYAIAGGNPAKVIRYRFDKNIMDKLMSLDLVKLFDSFEKEDLDDLYSELTEERLKLLLRRMQVEQA